MPPLNPQQRAAVRYLDGPLLVLAGAGSGKTRVITHKIAYLIRECGTAPRHIAAVTFTNKAAREMKARVGELLGAEAKGLKISTFHTLGLNMLRQELQTAGLRAGFSIFDAEDSAGLIKELLRKESLDDGRVKEAQWQISRWKSALLDPGRAVNEAATDVELLAATLYAGYQRHLRAYNAVDFDDLIALPVQLLRDDVALRERWQNRLRYLLVDEYQDTNGAQYQLVRLLSGVRGALTVVGDDDQSIYAWRGAQPENLAQLQQDYPKLKVIKLEQNYRSSGRILNAANALIANNPHVFTKRLWSGRGPGDALRVIQYRDEEHEAESVVAEILAHQFRHRTDFGDYAILYRGNHQARLFERALRDQRIPYYLSGGTSFFSHAEVRDVMAYLRLLVNPDDDAAFLRVVNTPRREIGPATLEKLAEYAGGRHISLFAACFELGLKQHLPERAVTRLGRFAQWLVDLGDRGRRGDPIAVVKDMIHGADYELWLRDNARDDKVAERRINNVWELVAWMQRLTEKDAADKTLADLVAHMSLMDILERGEEEHTGGRVHLMTLHAAKGLEFPHVFLVGMEEELLPHRNSLEAGTIEEERRLCYVGLTRARKTLALTLAARRKRGGERIGREPSRFLKELPQDDVVWEGVGQVADPVQRRKKGQAHMASLRSLLTN
ncbi:MAG TPA: DNA helicase Rep [Gammaproteobacteria bacterium]|nr:DNA helicase Rep [Gammaproteobacteria bacterium]